MQYYIISDNIVYSLKHPKGSNKMMFVNAIFKISFYNFSNTKFMAHNKYFVMYGLPKSVLLKVYAKSH